MTRWCVRNWNPIIGRKLLLFSQVRNSKTCGHTSLIVHNSSNTEITLHLHRTKHEASKDQESYLLKTKSEYMEILIQYTGTCVSGMKWAATWEAGILLLSNSVWFAILWVWSAQRFVSIGVKSCFCLSLASSSLISHEGALDTLLSTPRFSADVPHTESPTLQKCFQVIAMKTARWSGKQQHDVRDNHTHYFSIPMLNSDTRHI